MLAVQEACIKASMANASMYANATVYANASANAMLMSRSHQKEYLVPGTSTPIFSAC